MRTENLRIAVAGTGYAGLSIATLLSRHHAVTAVNILPEKVDIGSPRKVGVKTSSSPCIIRARARLSNRSLEKRYGKQNVKVRDIGNKKGQEKRTNLWYNESATNKTRQEVLHGQDNTRSVLPSTGNEKRAEARGNRNLKALPHQQKDGA